MVRYSKGSERDVRGTQETSFSVLLNLQREETERLRKEGHLENKYTELGQIMRLEKLILLEVLVLHSVRDKTSDNS